MRVTVSRHTFKQGPYNLGKWSILNGSIASIFLVATSICFFFPTNFDENMQQTWEDFNYSIFVFSGALLIAATYWFLPKSLGGARHFFTGPVRPEDVILDDNGELFNEKKFIAQKRDPSTIGAQEALKSESSSSKDFEKK